MTSMPKYVHVNDWIFEVKAVRALKVKHYGEPYSAIANISINGDQAYIDGLMTREEEAFTRADFASFKQFCRQLSVKQANFDRYHNQQYRTESVIIEPEYASSMLQLVK